MFATSGASPRQAVGGTAGAGHHVGEAVRGVPVRVDAAQVCGRVLGGRRDDHLVVIGGALSHGDWTW